LAYSEPREHVWWLQLSSSPTGGQTALPKSLEGQLQGGEKMGKGEEKEPEKTPPQNQFLVVALITFRRG